MKNLRHARVHTAGAYVSINGLYPFTIGCKTHNGNIPVVRLGGHREGTETGWECAAREVKEEAAITIRPVSVERIHLVYAGQVNLGHEEASWENEPPCTARPLLIVAYPDQQQVLLSLMYLAQADESPVPSAEVKGILLLDPSSIGQICSEPVTLGQYLNRGGKAILKHDFDHKLVLEPFIQLRLFAQILKSGWIPAG